MSYQYGAGSGTSLGKSTDLKCSTAGTLGLDFPPSYTCSGGVAMRGGGGGSSDCLNSGGGGSSGGYPTVSLSLPEPQDVVIEQKTKLPSSKSMRNELKKTFLGLFVCCLIFSTS